MHTSAPLPSTDPTAELWRDTIRSLEASLESAPSPFTWAVLRDLISGAARLGALERVQLLETCFHLLTQCLSATDRRHMLHEVAAAMIPVNPERAAAIAAALRFRPHETVILRAVLNEVQPTAPDVALRVIERFRDAKARAQAYFSLLRTHPDNPGVFAPALLALAHTDEQPVAQWWLALDRLRRQAASGEVLRAALDGTTDPAIVRRAFSYLPKSPIAADFVARVRTEVFPHLDSGPGSSTILYLTLLRYVLPLYPDQVPDLLSCITEPSARAHAAFDVLEQSSSAPPALLDLACAAGRALVEGSRRSSLLQTTLSTDPALRLRLLSHWHTLWPTPDPDLLTRMLANTGAVATPHLCDLFEPWVLHWRGTYPDVTLQLLDFITDHHPRPDTILEIYTSLLKEYQAEDAVYSQPLLARFYHYLNRPLASSWNTALTYSMKNALAGWPPVLVSRMLGDLNAMAEDRRYAGTPRLITQLQVQLLFASFMPAEPQA